MAGMPSGGLLRVDEAAVDRDFERAPSGGDQLDAYARVALLQGVRQTGGFGLVVSDDAVLDPDAHFRLLPEGSCFPGAAASVVTRPELEY